ncbi:ATP-binding region ATPase domain protein [Clostridium sp. DL-VIII]|uniref:ATP-binding protein n=1 Tax=Clostridium sp. DL-VIII TaxID=641107 RepID=UPI00023B033F|nr:ATP-binding protein [Clostridium sp. DL-VIII]EHJ01796.1 ATP-binding region ATPase domain protein [Clostridium sp. DL-VIII]
MRNAENEMIFYGLDNINNKLDELVETLNLKSQCFEIKLIVSEALNNSFVHGNKSDKNKPIYMKWELDEKKLILTVTDCGSGIENLESHKEINEDNILEESGRGLYIIRCYTDEVEFKDNSIIMKKYIS